MLISLWAGAIPVLLGLVFLTAGWRKTRTPESMSEVFMEVGLTRSEIGRASARVLGVGEIVLGGALIVGMGGAFILLVAVLALAGFTLVLRKLSATGFDASCGCFGEGEDVSLTAAIVRNVTLIVLGTTAWMVSDAGRDAVPGGAELLLGLALFVVFGIAYRVSVIFSRVGA